MSSQSTSSSSSTPTIPAGDLVTQNILNSISGVATQYAGALYQWGQGVFNNLQGNINGIMGNLETAAQSAMSGANTALGQFTNSFIPDYQQLRSDAQQYASPGREARNAGMAESDQMQANQSAIQQMEQKMQGYGINPSGPGYYGDLLAAKTAGAAAAAGAGTQSIRADEQTGLALKKQALDYGIQMPGIAANFMNQANQARSIAGNLDIGTANAGTGLMQVPNAYLNTAMQNKFIPPGQTSQSRQQSSSQQPSKSQGNNQGDNQGGPKNAGGPSNPNNKGDQTSGGGPQIIPNPFFDPNAGGNNVVNDANFTDYSQGNNFAFGGQQDPFAADYGGYNSPNTLNGSDPTASYNYGDPNSFQNNYSADPSSYGATNFDPTQSGWDNSAQTGGTADSGSYGYGSYGSGATDTSAFADNSGYSAPQDYSQQGWDQSYSDTSYSDNSGDYSGGFAEGGAIPDPSATTGGAVPQSASPSMGQQTDDIHAKVNADEFIMPRDVAVWKGQEFFYKLIADSRKKLAEAQASGVGGKPTSAPTGPVRFASNPVGGQ